MTAQSTLQPLPAEINFDPDTVNHWMRKVNITRGIIEGVPEKALCGKTFTPSSHGGDTSNPGSSVCPLCQAVFETLSE